MTTLAQHVRRLARAYRVGVAEAGRYVLVDDYILPDGYNTPSTALLLAIPPEYPLRAPGVLPYPVYVPSGMRYCGRPLAGVYARGPGWGNWQALCITRLEFDPWHDDLLRVLELVRALLTNPPTV